MNQQFLYGGRCAGKSAALAEAMKAFEQLRAAAGNNPRLQKAIAIFDTVTSAASNISKHAATAFPRKQFLPIRDRRPLKRINKQKAKAAFALTGPMAAIQIGLIASRPIPKYPPGSKFDSSMSDFVPNNKKISQFNKFDNIDDYESRMLHHYFDVPMGLIFPTPPKICIDGKEQ